MISRINKFTNPRLTRVARLIGDAARMLLPEPERLIQHLEPLIVRNQLSRFSFVALDRRGRCHARLVLAVDWHDHRRRASRGLDADKAGLAELRAITTAFAKIVMQRRLRIGLRLAFTGATPKMSARLTPAKSLGWANKPTSLRYATKQLPELEAHFELADD